MTDKGPANHPGEGKPLFGIRRKAVRAGAAAALFLMLLGAWGFRSILEPPAQPSAPGVGVVGLIDANRALEAHPGFEALQLLRKQEIRLRDELKTAMKPVKAEAPVVPEKPFQDAVWQKNAQNIIGTAAEIGRQKKKAAEEYRASTEAEYQAKCDEIDGEYLNAILNIQLKLQNQDNLRLSQETVEALMAEREALQMERGARQIALAKERESEITAYAEAAIKENREKLRQEAKESKTALELESAKKHAEGQARDAEAMDQAMQKTVERQQVRLRIFRELQDTIKERIELESRMMSDIAGQTAKLAILHHYTMVLASPPPTLKSRIPWQQTEKSLIEERCWPVVGMNTQDLTEELLTEIKNLKKD